MAKAEGSGSLNLKFKTVYRVIPKDDKERKQLDADLGQLGCGGFLRQPWSVRNDNMIRKLLEKQSNEWDKTI